MARASSSPLVLVSWIAVRNDPYEQPPRAPQAGPVDSIPGPTLTLLFDEESPFCGQVSQVVLLYRQGMDRRGQEERAITEETRKAILERRPGTDVEMEPWYHEDPTDHKAIFAFLREVMPRLRSRFPASRLILHISPGTPSMHTIWVLMAEAGLIGEPFELVKSYRRGENPGGRRVVPVEVGIQGLYEAYEAYRRSRPRPLTRDEDVLWQPERVHSPALRKVFGEAGRFAQLKVPVLILGERGTGKTALAAWLRVRSPYRRPEQDRSWPALACGQYSADLMRAELMGYKKNAFTGANKEHPGLLAAADKDTLFLDEIGDIHPDLQRLLIKAIEERRYQRLGDDEFRDSDFRLISATNLPIGELRKRLAPDFWDRISYLILHMPPLRDLGADLPWLWREIYERAARRACVPAMMAMLAPPHHDRVVTALRAHPLPGNLRDLYRVAYRLLSAFAIKDAPMGPAEAVDDALRCLKEDEVLAGDAPARAVSRAFADVLPLSLTPAEPLRSDALFAALRRYLATEVRRLAEELRCPVEQLIDKDERTLRTWREKEPAADAEKTGRQNSGKSARARSKANENK